VDSINTLRAVLVGGAVVAGIGAFLTGEVLAGLVMVVAVAAHGWLWWFLHQRRRQPAAFGVHGLDGASRRNVDSGGDGGPGGPA